jgi:hypothetical protein
MLRSAQHDALSPEVTAAWRRSCRPPARFVLPTRACLVIALPREQARETSMTPTATGDPIRGRTLRWTFTEGPQKGKTYEHTFHQDGTVTYRAIENESESEQTRGAGAEGERPPYAAYAVSDSVHLVSYRADSGFRLTVALNFADQRLVSIASNSEQWFPARGTFDVVDTRR